MSIEIKTVKTEKLEMKYFKFGAGNKPFVIIPGLDITSITRVADSVAAMFDKFTKEFSVYVFDRRSNLPVEYSIWDMADDMAEVMKETGIKNACIYGTSQGGMIAQEIAIKYPELVGKLILASTTSYLTKESKKIIHNWAEIAKTMDLETLAETFVKDIYTEEFGKKYRDILFAGTLSATKEDVDRFQILSKACDGWNAYDALTKIKCDTFVLGAKGDKIFKEKEFLDIAEKIGCESFIYEGYSHAVYDEALDFLDRVYEFVTKKNT